MEEARDWGTPNLVERQTKIMGDPLNTSQERIFKVCVNTEFNEVKIRNPYPIRESAQIEKSNYYLFHKSHILNTNDCIQLKDVIEGLIKNE